MALKESYMIKGSPLATVASLSVEAKVGESLLIKGLYFGALASGGFAEILIDRVSVGFFYIGDIDVNHLEQWERTLPFGNVFGWLVANGHMAGYPVAEGQTFEVRPHTAGTTVIGSIVYEVHEAGDMTSDMPNGSTGNEFLFLNYGTNEAVIAAEATGTLNITRNPSEYPAFPFGDVVPANYEMEVLGVMLLAWKDAQGNLNPNYAFLKLTKDRKVLFDNDRQGICVREGMGFLTEGPCRRTRMGIKLFPAPILFSSGDELLVQMTAGDTEIAASDILLAAVQKARRLE
ncbi:hypothetical protein ES707_09536 [subsurface metagenome]